MQADAPGKLVISGAYAVLRGAPAVVTAVSRRVLADTKRPPEFVAPEVVAGVALLGSAQPPPWYDASALRDGKNKLGLGSSAAICVASLGALMADASTQPPVLTEPRALAAFREKVYPLARSAHQKAQGGGSGIDVAAACFGGSIAASLDPNQLTAPPLVEPVTLPKELVFEVWWSRQSSSTSDFVRRVLEQESSKPDEFRRVMAAQTEASRLALDALKKEHAEGFIEALRRQLLALYALGQMAQIPIVLPPLFALSQKSSHEGCLLPSGAGGGDVNLFVGKRPSSEAFRVDAQKAGLVSVPLSLGAEGLRVLGSRAPVDPS